MSIDEVMSRVHELAGSPPTETFERAADTNWGGTSGAYIVELTGGEPLLQSESIELAKRLRAENYTVLVETSGERFIGALPNDVVKIVDVKCPDSGEGHTFLWENLQAVDRKDEIKFVISSRRDYEFARDFSVQNDLANRVRQVSFSPVFGDPNGAWQGFDSRILAEWILADRLPVRLGLQLHKFIWHPSMRGV